MSVHFNLDDFKIAFDAAVGLQRRERAGVDFEFNGQKLTIKGQTKFSDALFEYLDSLSSGQNFTGSEKFDEKLPDVFINFIKNNPDIDVTNIVQANHVAKLLQQATRNGRDLKDVWSSAPLNASIVKILTATWSGGEELEKLWQADLDSREQDAINFRRASMFDSLQLD